jgi:hypothetical protein
MFLHSYQQINKNIKVEIPNPPKWQGLKYSFWSEGLEEYQGASFRYVDPCGQRDVKARDWKIRQPGGKRDISIGGRSSATCSTTHFDKKSRKCSSKLET